MLIPLGVLAALLLNPKVVRTADTKSSDIGRPRGVGPECKCVHLIPPRPYTIVPRNQQLITTVVAKFYKSPDNTFACISNPSHRIPFSQVNDDYCDCPDGSDEPGTSACSYLSHLSFPQPRPGASALIPANESLALPGFYCKNKGHIPSYVRFENVNDGICDYEVCCDGSDEYAHIGGVKCEDRCAAIGKEYRKHEETRQKSFNKAIKKRKELQFEADKVKKEAQEKIEATEIRIQGLERKVKEAEDNLKDTERREKLRVVKSDAAGKGKGKLGVLLNLARDRVAELRKTLAKTREQRDAMLDRVMELEKMLTALKDEYNPNFNDAGVKKAVQGWEDYAARETTDHWTEAEDRDLAEIQKEDGKDSGINWAEFESSDAEDTASDAAAIYSLTSYLPPGLQTWLGSAVSGLRQFLIDNGVLPDSTIMADIQDSAAVKSARTARDDAQRDLSNAENDLRREKEDLDKDYGPSGIFRALKDKCVDKESGEYIYAHCFMSRTTQRPKKGGGETNMGNFVGFGIEYVDDDLPADNKGIDRGDHIIMKYENGQHCWNGPSRSTKVVLGCSEVDEIYKVSESEKCVYRMEVGTPAVCGWDKPSDATATVVGEAAHVVTVTESTEVWTTKDEL